MAEIKLKKRYKYAGDIFQKLVDVGLDIEAATAFLNEVEDADVVEVVRCKDCKHATFYNCKNDACYKKIICEYEIGTDDENFYCIYGEPCTPKERGGEK